MQAGLTVPHHRVVLIQAVTTLIEQLWTMPDELHQVTIGRYRWLCGCYECHTERDLAEHLTEQSKMPQCQVAWILLLDLVWTAG